MAFDDILAVSADAGVAWLKSQPITTIPLANIYPGLRHDVPTTAKPKENELRLTPRVEVVARHANALAPHFSGNWNVFLTFSVISNYQDTAAFQHRQRIIDVFRRLLTTTIAADLSNALQAGGGLGVIGPGSTAFGAGNPAVGAVFFVPVVVPHARDFEISGKLWIDSLELELREASLLAVPNGAADTPGQTLHQPGGGLGSEIYAQVPFGLPGG